VNSSKYKRQSTQNQTTSIEQAMVPLDDLKIDEADIPRDKSEFVNELQVVQGHGWGKSEGRNTVSM
jgi:hypothetical protein